MVAREMLKVWVLKLLSQGSRMGHRLTKGIGRHNSYPFGNRVFGYITVQPH